MDFAKHITTDSDGDTHSLQVYALPARTGLKTLQRLTYLSGNSIGVIIEAALSGEAQEGDNGESVFSIADLDVDSGLISKAVESLMSRFSAMDDVEDIITTLLSKTLRDDASFGSDKFNLNTFSRNYRELAECLRRSIAFNYGSFFSGLEVVRTGQKAD